MYYNNLLRAHQDVCQSIVILPTKTPIRLANSWPTFGKQSVRLNKRSFFLAIAPKTTVCRCL